MAVHENKLKLLKYLQTLCTTNGLDISNIRERGKEVEKLEIYFGGYPALVGLKYFSNLTCLKLIGQDIDDLRPLHDVVHLRELWVCEGPLQELTGLEHCKKLEKLYLYENQLSNADKVGELKNLTVLWLNENNISDIKFVSNLRLLRELYLTDCKITSEGLLSVSCPPLLEILELSGNPIADFAGVYGIVNCLKLENISFASIESTPCSICDSEFYLSWISFHFPKLEYLDSDVIVDGQSFKYISNLLETKKLENYSLLISLEKNFKQKLDEFEDKKSEILAKVHEIRPHFEFTARTVLDDYQNHMINLLEIDIWLLNQELESCFTISYKRNDPEFQGKMNSFLSRFQCPEVEMKSVVEGFRLVDSVLLTRNHFELSNLAFLLTVNNSDWELDSIMQISDRWGRVELEKDIKITKSLYRACQLQQNSTYSGLKSLLLLEYTFDTVHIQIDGKSVEDPDHQSIEERKGSTLCSSVDHNLTHCSDSEISVSDHSKLVIVGILFVETKFRNLPSVSQLLEFDNGKLLSYENIPESSKKQQNLLHVDHWRRHYDKDFVRLLTNRDPLRQLQRFGLCTYNKISEFQWHTKVTGLNLSKLGLSRINAIEHFTQLKWLNLARNKVTKIDPLLKLDRLQFVSLAWNGLGNLPDLSSLIDLMTLDVSHNHLRDLQFCGTLTSLIELNCSCNQIEFCANLQNQNTLQNIRMADNPINDFADLLKLQNLNLLYFLDLSNTGLAEMDDFRTQALYAFRKLKLLNCELVIETERQVAIKLLGYTLTLNYLHEKTPEYENLTILKLTGLELNEIKLGLQWNHLNHVTEIDLSDNNLENFGDLVNLTNLKILHFMKNKLKKILSEEFLAFRSAIFLPKLEILHLEENNLKNLDQIGLGVLKSLKELFLSKNKLVSIDGLEELTALEVMDLSFNDIRTIGPQSLISQRKVHYLNINNNRLKSLNNVGCMNSMKILDLSQNKIHSCNSMKQLTQLKHVTQLNMRGNPVTTKKVYRQFIHNHLSWIEILDGEKIHQKSSEDFIQEKTVKKLSLDPKWHKSPPKDIIMLEGISKWGRNINEQTARRKTKTFELYEYIGSRVTTQRGDFTLSGQKKTYAIRPPPRSSSHE